MTSDNETLFPLAGSGIREIEDHHWLTLCDRKCMADGLAEMQRAGWEAVGPVFHCGGHYAQPLVRTRIVNSANTERTDAKGVL